MKKFIFSLIIAFFMGISLSFAQVSPPAVIFNGSYGKFLPSDGLKFKNDITVTSGALDPTVTAFSAPQGSLYLSTSTGLLYQKQDSGSSTNWMPFFYGPTFSNDNRIVRTDGTDGLQDSGITLDDSDSVSGVFDLTATGDIIGGTVTGTTSVDAGNLQLSGNDIVSTDANGNISITPNGTGEVVVSTLEVSDLTNNAIAVPNGANGLESTGVTINGTDDISGARNITGSGQLAGATLDVGSTTAVDSILDEDDLSSDSATALATQQSIKAYVDSQFSGSGDVVGPSSATDSALALYDGTTGKLIKDSATTISIDDTLASDSDSLISTQAAVKGYVDNATSTLVAGPGPSTTDGQIAVFNGTGGYTIKGVPVAVDASGNVTGVADLTASGAIEAATIEGTTSITGGNIAISTNAISSNDTNGNINIAPNGTGETFISSVLSIEESTTPTATSGYGKVYPKTDGRLYYQNDASEEFPISGLSTPEEDPEGISNIGIDTSVAASALTVSLKQSDGSTDPTSGAPVYISFRSPTVTSGAFNSRSVTSSLSLTIPSGATLGTTDGASYTLYVYAIDNSGTVELAISGARYPNESELTNTTALSAASDISDTMYSTTARSNVPYRLIGSIRTTQTTAGTWANDPSREYVGFTKFNPCTYRMTTETPCDDFWVNDSRLFQRCATDSASRSSDFTIGDWNDTSLRPVEIRGLWRRTGTTDWRPFFSGGETVIAKFEESTGDLVVGIGGVTISGVQVCMIYYKI